MTKSKIQNPKILIAPSILSADFSKLGEEIKKVEKAGADMIHIDVMDGHFVPNITIGPLVVKAVRKITKLPLDVHLMIEKPEQYFEVFAKAGADIISFHVEASSNLVSSIQYLKKLGVKPAIAINPATPVESVFSVLDKVAMVLIMSVNPGFEGQKFMPEVLGKIRRLKAESRTQNTGLDIEVDGGINPKTAKLVKEAGANVLVAGSAIFYSKDYKKAIRELKI